MTPIVQNFDIWSDAQGLKSKGRLKTLNNIRFEGIARLRELILDLAMRGKLVPRDSEDESVEILLKKIAKKRAETLTEKSLDNIYTEHELQDKDLEFTIPDHWKWIRLADISEYIQRGKSPKYSDSGSIIVISQKCVQWSGLNLSEAKFIDQNTISGYHSERYLRKNDILWNSTGTGTVGRVSIVEDEMENKLVADSHVTVIRPIMVISGYLKNYLSSQLIQNKMLPDAHNSLVTGSTNQVELNRTTVLSLPIPLPPIEEQRRIVSKIDDLMRLCDKLEEKKVNHLRTHHALTNILLKALTQADNPDELHTAWHKLSIHFDTLFSTEESIDQLKKTILQLAIMGRLVPQNSIDESVDVLIKKIEKEKKDLIIEGTIRKEKPSPQISKEEEPFNIPENWKFVRLQQIVSILGDGIHGTPIYDDNGNYFFINGNNLNDGTIDIKPNTKTISEKEYAKHKRVLNEKTILVSINGTIGNTASYRNEQVILGKSVCYFNLLGEIDKEYIRLILKTMYFLQYALSEATGTTIKNVSLKTMRSFIVPLPPIAEQRRITAKVVELTTLCEDLKNRIIKSGKVQQDLSKAAVDSAITI